MSSGVDSNNESIDITKIIETEQQFQEINKIKNYCRQLERFYYIRPPMDMLFEKN